MNSQVTKIKSSKHNLYGEVVQLANRIISVAGTVFQLREGAKQFSIATQETCCLVDISWIAAYYQTIRDGRK